MSGVDYPVADQMFTISDLLTWVGQARTEIARLRAERDAAVARAAVADDLLSDGMSIVLSLSGGYDVWSERVRDHLDRDLRQSPGGEADR